MKNRLLIYGGVSFVHDARRSLSGGVVRQMLSDLCPKLWQDSDVESSGFCLLSNDLQPGPLSVIPCLAYVIPTMLVATANEITRANTKNIFPIIKFKF